MKTFIKFGFAYLLMFGGVAFALLGEHWLVNHYFIERFTVGAVLFILGAYYWYVLDVRMEKYGRC
jgi:4-amino-4-deoxy-L-arabinose transferase-like glycosyltransferase